MTMDKKVQPRLGRGLDSLFGGPLRAGTDGSTTPSHATPAGPAGRIPTSSVHLNPYQPRKTFDEDELQKLEDSIRTHGVLTPLLVRPIADGFQLIAGERRLRVAKRAALTEIPANIREMDEQQV